MTPAELKAAREALGLSLSGLAKALRMGKTGRDTIRAWESGDNDRGVPGPAQVAIECLLNHGLQTGLQTASDRSNSNDK